ncbi:MAG: class I SAM-dependent methyltransferase [Chlorobiaceae bacterium]|nr:class I SAM-dependent methyltransferase [Chlorobiaceae bacterium]
MERVPCPITGNEDFTPFLQVPDRFTLPGPSWQLVRSNSSGLVMLNPRPSPDEMAAHYPAESYDPFLHRANCRSLRDRAYLATSSLLLRGKANFVMQGINKPPDSVHILETGCSSGRLLLALHRHHGVPLQHLYGVEPDRAAALAARCAGVGNVTETELADAVFDLHFDRIIFWHSLEHLHRTGETLDRAHELLNPEGIVIIALPNLRSDDARRYGPHWIALDAPRHLCHFTPETLGRILEKHGFSVLDFSTWMPDTLYNVWYSEKLDRAVKERTFGFGGFTQATANTIRSFVAGIDPRRASSMVVRAVVKRENGRRA